MRFPPIPHGCPSKMVALDLFPFEHWILRRRGATPLCLKSAQLRSLPGRVLEAFNGEEQLTFERIAPPVTPAQLLGSGLVLSLQRLSA